MPNDGKTTTDVYQRFPKNRKTLGVRWPKRHGVTAPLITQEQSIRPYKCITIHIKYLSTVQYLRLRFRSHQALNLMCAL